MALARRRWMGRSTRRSARWAAGRMMTLYVVLDSLMSELIGVGGPMSSDMSESSTTYKVIIRPAAQRALRRVDRPIQRRLANAMADLATDPRPVGTKALQGHRPLLRVRVGDYRI